MIFFLFFSQNCHGSEHKESIVDFKKWIETAKTLDTSLKLLELEKVLEKTKYEKIASAAIQSSKQLISRLEKKEEQEEKNQSVIQKLQEGLESSRQQNEEQRKIIQSQDLVLKSKNKMFQPRLLQYHEEKQESKLCAICVVNPKFVKKCPICRQDGKFKNMVSYA